MKSCRELILDLFTDGQQRTYKDVGAALKINASNASSLLSDLAEKGQLISHGKKGNCTYEINKDFVPRVKTEFFCTSCQTIRAFEGSKKFRAANGIVRQKCACCVSNEVKKVCGKAGRKPKPPADYSLVDPYEDEQFARNMANHHG